MVDRAQLIKHKSEAVGGNCPVNPQEDMLEIAGLYLQDGSNRDETTYIIRFDDTVQIYVASTLALTIADGKLEFGTKPVITGKSNSAALDNLCVALETMGLIVNNTT